MAHPNEAPIRQAFAALADGDLEAAMQIVADDAVWHVGGNNPHAGDYTGREAIRAMGEVIASSSRGTFRAYVHDVLANDGPYPDQIPLGHAVALLSLYAEHDGEVLLDVMGAQIMHFRDGKAVEWWFAPIDQGAVDQFLSASSDRMLAAAALSDRGRRGY